MHPEEWQHHEHLNKTTIQELKVSEGTSSSTPEKKTPCKGTTDSKDTILEQEILINASNMSSSEVVDFSCAKFKGWSNRENSGEV